MRVGIVAFTSGLAPLFRSKTITSGWRDVNTKFNFDSSFRSLFNLTLLRLTPLSRNPLSQQRSLVPRTANMANNNSFNFDFNRIASLEQSNTQTQTALNNLEQTVVRLEREVNDQKAARKKLEEELQRARLAEKVARDALNQLRSTNVMSQDATESKEKEDAPKNEQPEASKDPTVEMPPARDGYTWVEDKYIQEMVKRLDDLKKHQGMVEEQMRIFQKRHEENSARLKDSNTRNEEQLEDLREMRSEIDKSHKKIGDQQQQILDADQKHQQILDAAAHRAKVELDTAHSDLNIHKDRIHDLEKELQQKTEKVSTTNDALVKAEKDNGKLLQEAKEWTDKTAYLTEVNDTLLEDIKKSNSEHEAVAHERDELKLSLAEAESALADITAAEVASRDSHNLLARRMQEAADTTHEDTVSLQKNFDNVLSQMDDLKKEVAMKDFTIARQEKRIRDLMQERDNERAPPRATPHKSLAEELEMADFGQQSESDESSEPALSGAPDQLQLSGVTGVSTAPDQRRSRPSFDLLYAITVALLCLFLRASGKLKAWEGANGVGFGEGYGGKFAYEGAFNGYN